MSKQAESLNDFGLLIAYVIPGFSLLYGTSYLVPELQVWFSLDALNAMSGASLVLLAVTAIGAGLVAHTIRWCLLDSLHHWTGLRPQQWDFSKFAANLGAYDKLTENHYRYYQFYGGMVVTLAWSLIARSYALQVTVDANNLALVVLMILMAWGSRDTLSRYYSRLNAVLSQA